jgi:hypothetical protein
MPLNDEKAVKVLREKTGSNDNFQNDNKRFEKM